MRFKKTFALLIGCLMLLSMPLAGCDTTDQDRDNIDDGIIADEDITVEGIDKEDSYTWFDLNKTDLPSLEECQQITAGMSLNQVIRRIGKPQREIGYGTWIFQFDVDDGSVLTVSFVLDEEKERPSTPTYDCLIVLGAGFDREIPDVYFPFQGSLNELYPWIDGLLEEDISEVRYEQAFIGVAPGRLKDISYSTNRVDIENTFRLLSSPVQAISNKEGEVDGGGYVKYDFFTANNETFSITISNKTVLINNQYYRFVDDLYTFRYSERDCHSFITYSDTYEIYTYANESIKIGDYDGLGEFEFQIYEGFIESAPKFYLRSSAVDLLILSENLFMIEGEDNTVIYQITGKKDFSALFLETSD